MDPVQGIFNLIISAICNMSYNVIIVWEVYGTPLFAILAGLPASW